MKVGSPADAGFGGAPRVSWTVSLAQRVVFPLTVHASLRCFSRQAAGCSSPFSALSEVPNRLCQFVHQPLQTLILIRALIP
jgi:hypothetical protein